MFNLNEAFSFEQYMSSLSEHHKEVYKKTSLSQNTKEKLKGLSKKINMVVFTEGYCPDCTVTLPVVKRFQENNSNVNIYIMGIEANKEFLEENLGEARIPTVMAFDADMNPLGVYVEFPKDLKEKIIEANMEEKKLLIEDYRAGKYNSLIEEDFIDIIFS